MNELFDICVHLLEWIARLIGITYKEANIYIFVIGYPLLFLITALYFRFRIRSLKRRIKSLSDINPPPPIEHAPNVIHFD